ncbi:hypothetical protein ABAC460_02290 [Asticcacaulis sp. AC460]|uniref:NAD(P)/FAD-dependent oxidoreductase n=1 Tax=Asticcacaulis sp. AC460 TaxID=1282360 RepID=UPI0003C3AD14|nr:NAD(P)/FAD-dependent oxidoreductase [Asticcacaulis sp. AC460]ESQ93108.1 hypothetical protein ABAC460_02290 [Asticcacaulis sp. AC460]
MSTLHIVGGGLSGLTAALMAHDQGWRDIRLYERTSAIGGVAQSRIVNDHEVRTGTIYFGDDRDPQLTLLRRHGLNFEPFENRFGSVSVVNGKDYFQPGFGGPVIAAPDGDIALNPGPMTSLQDRFDRYPTEIAQRLTTMAQWHLNADPARVIGDGAVPMAMNRVIVADADNDTLKQLKQYDSLYDELYGLPRDAWGYSANATAHLPVGGFPRLFDDMRQVLNDLNIAICDRSLITPKVAHDLMNRGERVYWSANPMPLFPHAGMKAPQLLRTDFHVVSLTCRYGLEAPYYIQNFTTEGAIFRLYAYPTATASIVTLECVRPANEADLRLEAKRLVADTPIADLLTGEVVLEERQPRWLFHTVETVAALGVLRHHMAERYGACFIPGGWEQYAKAAKHAALQTALDRVAA